MSTDRNNLAKRTPVFSRIYQLARKFQSDLNPLFSISSARFHALSGLALPPNPFIFNRLRTSTVDYRGWGCPALPATALPIRVYPHEGVNPRPSVVPFSPPATRLFSRLYKRVRSSLKTSALKYLYFHTLAHSFAANPVFSTSSQKHTGGWGYLRLLPAAPKSSLGDEGGSTILSLPEEASGGKAASSRRAPNGRSQAPPLQKQTAKPKGVLLALYYYF